MSNREDSRAKKGFGLMYAGMAVCCTLMLIPVAGFFIAGGTLASLTNNLGLFAPIALCIGVHATMFAVMGNSCHGDRITRKPVGHDVPVEPSRIPAVSPGT